MKTTAISPERGGAGRKRVDGAKTQVAPQAQRGGASRNYTTKKEGEKSHCPIPLVLYHSRSGKNTQNAPGPEVGGSAGRKRNEYEKHTVMCLN